jgi:cytochrome c553
MRFFRQFGLHRSAVLLLLVTSASESSLVTAAEKPQTADPTPEQLKFFENEVRPLLAENCFKCHGDDKQQGELRLDSLAAMTHGGDSGPAIVPGKPSESLLLEAVRYESFEMPPSGQLSDEKVAKLEKWIEMGAPWAGTHGEFDVAQRNKEKITDADRAYWAFQPPIKTAPPKLENDDWSTGDIDRFLFSRMREAGLAPAAPADNRVLIRRVYFDMLGIPPTPEEVDAFVTNESPDAWENLVDKLLERPEYGEHWAKLWLDLVRYAESDGFRQDAYRPNAWKYRDYVIRSLNNDKPYNQFVAEQLAGDEIAPHDPDALLATGYLTHGVYEHNQRDVKTQWQDMLNDITDVTSEVFLAMGMGCARCHDHKFDPILQKDYFRLQAFFRPIQLREDVPIASAEEVAEYQNKLAAWEAKTADIRKEVDELERQSHKNAAERAIVKFPADVEAMIRKPAAERTPLEHQLALLALRQVEPADISKKLPAEKMPRWKELQAELEKFAAEKPKPLPTGQTVTDIGADSSPTFIVGKHKSEDIRPGFLSVIDPANADLLPAPHSLTTGRRSTLAAWIASEQNPLTARVMVNRVWQQHFGRGIVSTPSDFGRLGEPPSHPQLLDYLAVTFMEEGWSLKKLHRRILLTAAYRQSSKASSKKNYEQDVENRWLSHMPVRRMTAEQIRDNALTISGELKVKRDGGPESSASTCRSIFTKVLRNSRDPLLDAFDAPDYFSSSSTRNVTTTAPQALLMINGDWTLKRAAAFAKRLDDQSTTERKIIRAFHLAWGRSPTQAELADALEYVSGADGGPGTKVELANWGDETSAALLVTDQSQPVSLPEELRLGEVITIEAKFQIDKLYSNANVRTVVSRWNGSKTADGWSLGVTSEKSAYQPRNLIVQLVGKDNGDKFLYEVIPSDLRPELGKQYLAVVTIDLRDDKREVRFAMKNLSDADAPIQTASVKTSVKKLTADAPLIVGGRAGSSSHRLSGRIRLLRLSTADILKVADRQFQEPNKAQTIANWQFFGEHPLEDQSSHSRDLQAATTAVSSVWVDFCHVLLNANESLYLY